MYSVLVLAFDCSKTILSAIESVLNQTQLDLTEEILVINDGSTDDTGAVLLRYLTQPHAVLIRYFSQTNHGGSTTRNFGIRKAAPPWIALLDADDMRYPENLERQVESIQANPKIKLLGSKFHLTILFGQKKGLVHISPQDLCIRSVYWIIIVVLCMLTLLERGKAARSRRSKLIGVLSFINQNKMKTFLLSWTNKPFGKRPMLNPSFHPRLPRPVGRLPDLRA